MSLLPLKFVDSKNNSVCLLERETDASQNFNISLFCLDVLISKMQRHTIEATLTGFKNSFSFTVNCDG
jgi:hypothetical protein